MDSLQKKNAEALSFYPKCVFEREAENWRILLGLLNGQPAGYLYDMIIGDDETRRNAYQNLDILIADATAGIADAQYTLGRMYKDFGMGLHFVDAVEWFGKAGAQGHTDAQIELGNSYHSGKGVALDREEGNRWILRAKLALASAESKSGNEAESGNEAGQPII
jgi:TPR repeat protein